MRFSFFPIFRKIFYSFFFLLFFFLYLLRFFQSTFKLSLIETTDSYIFDVFSSNVFTWFNLHKFKVSNKKKFSYFTFSWNVRKLSYIFFSSKLYTINRPHTIIREYFFHIKIQHLNINYDYKISLKFLDVIYLCYIYRQTHSSIYPNKWKTRSAW